MSVSSLSRVVARGAALLSVGLAAAAIAQSSAQIDVNGDSRAVTRAVSVADLDLAAPAGQRALDRRLKVAAGAVCDVWDVSATRPVADYSRCYAAALSGARARAGLAENGFRATGG